MPSVRELLLQGRDILSKMENPALESRLLLSHFCGIPPLELLAEPLREIEPCCAEKFLSAASERAQKSVPLQYMTGMAAFRMLDLQVSEAVLIPRPETEQLVTFVLEHLKSIGKADVLDLCTGSGAVALSVKAECPEALVKASDLSESALAVARSNAFRLGLEVEFFQSDLFGNIPCQDFDVIVSNPPYIALDEYEKLPDEVRFHEPSLALTDQADGLSLIRRIVSESPFFLKKGGWLLLEIGETQGETVREWLEERGFTAVSILGDLAGRRRFAAGMFDN